MRKTRDCWVMICSMAWVAFVLICLRFTFVANFGDITKVFVEELVLLVSVFFLNVLFLKQKVTWRIKSSFKETLLIMIPVFFFFMIDILVSSGRALLDILKAGGISVIVALFEEYYFRGIIFSKINFYLNEGKAAYAGRIKACLYSGLIFGGFHFINLFHQSFYITTLQVIQVTCLGLVLCALYLRSGSLILPIMLHAAIDFISFISSGPEVDAHLTLTGCLTGAVVYIVIAFLLLNGGRRRIAAEA